VAQGSGEGFHLISPSEFAKDKVLAIQEYCLLAARSVANLFKPPRYGADTLHQADPSEWVPCPS
jgi:hypothetical protein